MKHFLRVVGLFVATGVAALGGFALGGYSVVSLEGISGFALGVAVWLVAAAITLWLVICLIRAIIGALADRQSA